MRIFIFIINVFVGGFVLATDMEVDKCQAVRTRPSVCEDGTDVPKTLGTLKAIDGIAKNVAAQIKQLDDSERRAGRDLKVILLARQGTAMENWPLLKDQTADGKARSLQQLVEQAQMNEIFSHGDGRAPISVPTVLYNERDTTRRMKYSHLGIAIKNHIKSDAATGEWMVVNLLRKCKENSSGIYTTDLNEFFSDNMTSYNAQILVPSQKLQDNLEKLLLDDKIRTEITDRLHVPQYNAAARWDSSFEANSNQWVVDVIAAAMRPIGQVRSRADTLNVLKQTDFRPTLVLGIGLYAFATTRWGEGQLPNFICFRNQRYPDLAVVELTSVLAIEEYLKRNHQLQQALDVFSK